MALIVPSASAYAQLPILKDTAPPVRERGELLRSGEEIAVPVGVLPPEARGLTRPTPFDCDAGPVAQMHPAACGWAGSCSPTDRTVLVRGRAEPPAGLHGTALLNLGCLLTI